MVLENCPEQYWKPCSYEGTIRVDFSTGRTELLWDGKFNAEAFSPDGQSILLSAGSNLYVADLQAANPVQIATNFAKGPEISALWIRPDQIAFLGTRGSEKYVYLVKPDGTDLLPITHYRRKPLELVPVNNTGGVLWQEGWFEPGKAYSGGFYWTDLETMSTYALPDSSLASPSPSGSQVAYESQPSVQDEAGTWYPVSHLMVLNLETLESREIPLPDLGRLSGITNLLWLPDGQHLLVGRAACRSETASRWICDMYRAAIIDLEGNEVEELPEQLADAGGHPWHSLPDGTLLYRVSWGSRIELFDLETLTSESRTVLSGDAPLNGVVIWGPSGLFWSTPALAGTPPANTGPIQEWLTLEDPFGRYIAAYPRGWHARPSQGPEPGMAAFITSFDPSDQFAGPAGELSVPDGEFMVIIALESTEVVQGNALAEWVEERAGHLVAITSVVEETLGSHHVVRLDAVRGTGESLRSYYFTSPFGVMVIWGAPMGEGADAATLRAIAESLQFSD